MRDGEALDGPIVSMTPLLFGWKLSVRRTNRQCPSECPDVLPERALLGMHVVSSPEKLRNMRELAVDQDIQGDVQMRERH